MKKTMNTTNMQQTYENVAATVEQFLARNGYHSITEIAEMGQMSRSAVIQCLLKKYGNAILQSPKGNEPRMVH